MNNKRQNKIGFVSPERRYEAPTVARPPQMQSDYYGERCQFLCGFLKASGNLRMRKTDFYLLEYIQTEMS